MTSPQAPRARARGFHAHLAEERDRVGMARDKVWRELLGLVQGAQEERARVPSQKTVGRWLDRWVEDGLMVTDHMEGSNSGRPPLIYRTSRALSLNSCPLSESIPEFFQRKGSVSDTESVCPKVPEASTTTEDRRAQPISSRVEAQPVSDTPVSVQNKNPVPDSDLESFRTKDTHNRSMCARARDSKAQEAEELARVGMTREEVWRELLGLVQGAQAGQGPRLPSSSWGEG